MNSNFKNQIGLTLMTIILGACIGNTKIVEQANREFKEVQKIETNNDTTLIMGYVIASEDSLGFNIKRVTRMKPIKNQSFFYVIKKRKNDELLAYKYIPYIESGDFSVVIYHFFDKEGRTIAYKKRIRFLNSICSEDVLIYDVTEYFNFKGQSIKSVSSLINLDGKEMDKKGCIINYSFNDRIYLKAIEIPFYSRL